MKLTSEQVSRANISPLLYLDFDQRRARHRLVNDWREPPPPPGECQARLRPSITKAKSILCYGNDMSHNVEEWNRPVSTWQQSKIFSILLLKIS